MRTDKVLRTRIKKYYADCAQGDCFWCVYHASRGDATHYNFRESKLWWWTGDMK